MRLLVWEVGRANKTDGPKKLSLSLSLSFNIIFVSTLVRENGAVDTLSVFLQRSLNIKRFLSLRSQSLFQGQSLTFIKSSAAEFTCILSYISLRHVLSQASQQKIGLLVPKVFQVLLSGQLLSSL